MKTNTMSFKIALLAALCGLISSCAHNVKTPPTAKTSHLDEAVGSIDSLAGEIMQKTGIPGMAVAVVHDGKVIYAKGFGVRQVHTDLKVTPDTVFQIASVSKSISGSVIAGLVGRGVLKWDDPVQKYLPDFTLYDPDSGKKVTIRDMYSHRSGLPGAIGDELEFWGCNRTQIIHRLRYLPVNPIGKVYAYSNFAMTTGAEAAAHAASKPWEDVSQDVLYGPLGMTQTSSRFADFEKRPNKSSLHILNDKNEWVLSHRQPDAQSPAGGVTSTVNDFGKWMIMEIDQGSFEGKQIIEKNALLQTWEPMMKMPDRADIWYGLGMIDFMDDKGQKHLAHSGAFSAGASTTYEMIPAQKIGIVVFTNGIPLGLPEALVKEFYNIYNSGKPSSDRFQELAAVFKRFSTPTQEQKTADDHSKKTTPAPAIAGTYQNDYFGTVTIAKKGTAYEMVINPCGKDHTYALAYKDANTFTYVMQGNVAEVKFHASEGTKPDTIKLEVGMADEPSTLKKVK